MAQNSCATFRSLSEQKELWGSDAIAAMLRALDIPYLALNPGASYRGLHDSIVNYLGNERPQMLLCLHEEAAVAIAHGYAKASGRMMGVVLHSNVGLMHGSMAIFNAWCDRVPMLILGATGPWDAAKRRPWIDWIHTASDQGALVRDYTKWDNQPASVPAAYEALLRAVQIADTAPRGPTYVNLDAALQEAKIGALPPLAGCRALRSARPPCFPRTSWSQAAAQLLSDGEEPGHPGRTRQPQRSRLESARRARREAAGARAHRHQDAGGIPDRPSAARRAAGDVSGDAARVLKRSRRRPVARLGRYRGHAQAGLGRRADRREGDPRLGRCAHRTAAGAWTTRACRLSDVYLMCEPDVGRAAAAGGGASPASRRCAEARSSDRPTDDAVSIRALAQAFNELTEGMDVCLSQAAARLERRLPALHASARLPRRRRRRRRRGGAGADRRRGARAEGQRGAWSVGIMGDGDFLMGVTALWTATHYKLPCLILVANNRSFYNDELHQERVAHERGRPVENKWIGQRIDEPDIDLAAMARAQGAVGIGPVKELSRVEVLPWKKPSSTSKTARSAWSTCAWCRATTPT